MPGVAVRELVDLAHAHAVGVSTGGFIEYVLTQGPEAVDAYLQACKDLGFDTIELSAGFITLGMDDWMRLVRQVHAMGMKAKAEVGIQFGAGGASTPELLEAAGSRSIGWMIHQAQRLL